MEIQPGITVERSSDPPRSSLARSAGLAVAVKALGLSAIWCLFLITPVRDGDKGFAFKPSAQSSEERWAQIEERFFERLAPYDGQWYLDIAERGYRELDKRERRSGRRPPGNYAFFPLLPLLLRGLESVAPGWYLALSILFLIALSALGVVTVSAVARELGMRPDRPALLLLAFPTAAFQYVLYTEGLFLFLSALVLLLALRRRPWPAAALALLAGLTRPQGVLLALPLGWELVVRPILEARNGRRRRPPLLPGLLASLLPASGLVAMSVISCRLTGSPLAFIEIQSRWGREGGALGIVQAFSEVFGYPGPPMDLLGLALGVGLLPCLWRRLPVSLALYGTAMLLMPLSTGALISLGRFMSVSIAHFLCLAMLLERRSWLYVAVVTGSFLLQLLLARGLIGWHFVG